MNNPISLDDIVIRTELRPGDIGYITYLHGLIYNQEHGFGIDFESYVANSLHEFYSNYDPAKNRVWICEHNGNIIGSLVQMHRDINTAELRYFVIPERPEGTEGMDEQALAGLVSRDAMIGTAVAASPESTP